MKSRLLNWIAGKTGATGTGREDSNGHGPWPAHQKNYANPVEDVHIWEYEPAKSHGAAIQVVTQTSVYDVICQQAREALPNETGGFLMGQIGRDIARRRWHLFVDCAEPVIPVEAAPTHFSFTWRDVERVRSLREKKGRALVGWYHTHPDLGVFLSQTDVEKTHNRLFNDEFQIALVLDPVQGTAAYFCRDDGVVFDSPHDEFQLEFGGGTL
jgi:proteasome lid subunit RPN8/RPN11